MWAGGVFKIALTVPEGDATTTAEWAFLAPDGTSSSGSGSGSADFKTWTAVVPATAAGWGLLTWTVAGAGIGITHQRLFVAATPTAWGVWPPCLEDLKTDMQRDGQVDVSDQGLQMQLDAAIRFVINTCGWRLNLGGSESGESTRSDPDYDLILGTLRLAARWQTRKRSPDGMIPGGPDLGDNRVTSFDEDIDRLLRIGARHTPISAHFAHD